MRQLFRCVAIVIFVCACGGSGGDNGGDNGGPTGPITPTVDHVTVSPSISTLASGATQQFSATALSATNVTVPGVSFTWASDDTDAVRVSATGLATGVHVGTAHISATTNGITGTLPLTVTSGPAVALQKQVPDPVNIAAGTALSTPLSVKVVDAAGNPVPSANVAWTATAGTLSAASTPTTTTGVAQVTWTLGTTAGAQSVTATVGSSTVTFATVAVPGAVVTLSVVGTSTNAATDTVDKPLPALQVVAKDKYNNVVPGATVSWAASTGHLSAPTSLTDASGMAQAVWTLGSAIGAATATATAQGTAVTAQFTTTVHAGAPAQFANVTGNSQSGVVGSALSTPLSAVLADRYGNPEGGVPVTWSVAGGGSIAAASTSTSTQGAATATFTLGTSTTVVQSATLQAGGKSLTFAATPRPDAPVLLTVVVTNVSSQGGHQLTSCSYGQTGLVACTFHDPPASPDEVGDESQLIGTPCAAATATDRYGNVLTDSTQYHWSLSATIGGALSASACVQPPAGARNPPAPRLVPSAALLPPTRMRSVAALDGRVITGSGGAQNGADGGDFYIRVGTLSVHFHVYWF